MKQKRMKRLIMYVFTLVTLFAFSGVASAYSGFPNDDWNYSLFGYVQSGTTGAKAIAVQYHCYTHNSNMEWTEIDGVIGPNSVNYIKEYQRRNGLTADGKVGTQTWRSMRNHLYSASGDSEKYSYCAEGPRAVTPQSFWHYNTGVWYTSARDNNIPIPMN